MNEQEFQAILNSDSKLWDHATTEIVGPNAIKKTITIPWGIGEKVVTLEGTGDAKGKREAFSAFGGYVRELVDDRIGDEAVEERAKQAASKALRDADQLSMEQSADSGAGGLGQVSQGVQEAPDKGAVQTFGGPSVGGEGPAARLARLRAERSAAEDFVGEATIEIEALNAYMEILNAPAHKKAPHIREDAALREDSEGD